MSELARISGKKPETIKKRLGELSPSREDGRTLYYRPREALPLIFQSDDPQAEKARLDRARADLAEHDLALKRREALDATEVEEAWTETLSALRNRLLAIPGKAAPHAAQAASTHEAQEAIREEIEAALAELSQAQPTDPGRKK